MTWRLNNLALTVWRLDAQHLLDPTSSRWAPMSELIGDIRAEPKPGTALRIVVEEHRHLDEFMAMVRAKMELDAKHLSELKTLRDSWSPEWNESGVLPLISPLLTHINNEIDERERTVTELNSHFAALPARPHPNATQEDGFVPLEIYENVETRYHQYKQSHETICTPEAIRELDAWKANDDLRRSFTIEAGSKNAFVFPRPELEYRRAVVEQQTAVKHAVKWQADTLPDTLERHQQRAEDVKSFLNILFTCYSSKYFNLSTSCSAVLNSNRAFSSSEFIAPRHGETGNEASHALLQIVRYWNHMKGGEAAQPIFGLGVKRTVSVVNELLNYNPTLLSYVPLYGGGVYLTFGTETAAVRSELSALLEDFTKRGTGSVKTLVACAFLQDEPLLPLPEDVITQYRNGISRAKLSNVMATYLPFARQEVVTLILRFAKIAIRDQKEPMEHVWRRMAIYLCHNAAAAGIIGSIWRKWDIVNDRSLPEGVERMWAKGGVYVSEVVWKETGNSYYITMPNSFV